jgi:hypothetical protein
MHLLTVTDSAAKQQLSSKISAPVLAPLFALTRQIAPDPLRQEPHHIQRKMTL